MKKVISVIIPVYNVAAYLPQCLDSLLAQDYQALEIILVDDGSKDESGAICDAYGEKDSRIRVIHQKNGGAAAAKNTALRAATGELLSFVDSDDYLEPNAYSYMVDLLESTGSDVGVFAFTNEFRSHAETHIPHPNREKMTGTAYLQRFTTRDWTCALLWNKLYKRSLFDGVFFEEGHRIDDEYFTYKAFLKAETVVCDNRVIYHYRRRASSAMLNPAARERLALDRIDFHAKRREIIRESCPQLQKAFDIQFLDALTYLPTDPENGEESIRRIKQELKQYFLQPGNTFPPKHLWRRLLWTGLTSTENLLQQRRTPETNDCSDYFA